MCIWRWERVRSTCSSHRTQPWWQARTEIQKICGFLYSQLRTERFWNYLLSGGGEAGIGVCWAGSGNARWPELKELALTRWGLEGGMGTLPTRAGGTEQWEDRERTAKEALWGDGRTPGEGTSVWSIYTALTLRKEPQYLAKIPLHLSWQSSRTSSLYWLPLQSAVTMKAKDRGPFTVDFAWNTLDLWLTLSNCSNEGLTMSENGFLAFTAKWRFRKYFIQRVKENDTLCILMLN